MKTSLSRLFAVVGLAVFSAASVAQAQWMIGVESDPLGNNLARKAILLGPTVGLNRNYHSGGFRALDQPLCPVFQGGSGAGYLFGITGEIQHDFWSVIPRVSYESRPGNFSEDLEDADVFIPDEGITVKQSVKTTSEISYKLLNAEVMFKHDILLVGNSFRLALSGGPAMGYVLDGRITQIQQLEQPLNARFVNPTGLPTDATGRRLIYADNEDIPGRKSLRFSLKAGVHGEIALYDKAVIMYPGIYFDYGLNNVTSNENWNLNTVVFQVDFRHAFF
jgi:hypothetical protein